MRLAAAGHPLLSFTVGEVNRFMDTNEGAVTRRKQVEIIIIDLGARRHVHWYRPPLTASAQHVKERVDHFSQVHPALVAATFSWKDEWPNKLPFPVRPIAGMPQGCSVLLDSNSLQEGVDVDGGAPPGIFDVVAAIDA
jgi:hypothetical protein